MSIISILLFALFLTLFDLDEILVKAINEIFNKNFSTSIYWLAAFIIGLVITFIDFLF